MALLDRLERDNFKAVKNAGEANEEEMALLLA
jgi:hypothetical protein